MSSGDMKTTGAQFVKLGGVTIKRVTAHNARYVLQNKIGPGAIVRIVRSGMVIPKIIETVKKASSGKADFPKDIDYKWDANRVHLVAQNLTDDQEQILFAKRLTESLKIIGVEGIRLQSCMKLVEADFNDLVDVYQGSVTDFEDTGIGSANSVKLVAGLKAAKRTVTHPKLMYASHCWPGGISDSSFDKILDVIPWKRLIRLSPAQIAAQVGAIHGFSATTGKMFAKNLPKYQDFLEELGWQPKTDIKIAVEGRLSGKTFVFTKIRDKLAEHNIAANGGKVTNSVNANTTVLVVRSKNETSEKHKKAQALGIPIMDLNEFKVKYKV